ncbi:MAG: DEAD/DEAH box helicase [Flavobacteriales bacterium]
MSFEKLGIDKKFILGLHDMKIETPTEIQKKIIPLLIGDPVDIIGQAETGTGKTAAFGLPLLSRVDSNDSSVQGLILCPTRELGKQVAKQLFKYTKYSDKIFTEAVYGGEHIERQMSALSRPTHIVVATPGRLIDLVEKKQLDTILNFLPNVECKWLFSATMPNGIKEIISTHLSPDAEYIKVNQDNFVNKKIKHQYLICDDNNKLNILLQFLKTEHKNRGIIFCKTKAATKKLAKQLIAKNVSTDAIHGDLLQKERDKVMRAFKGEKIQILVSTDVAARGIDVEGLSYVVHYQLPESNEYYLHRSGRTARAGKEGVSLALINQSEVRTIRNYERTLRIGFKQVRERD